MESGHKLRIIVGSQVSFPPTKEFTDKKKEQKRKACRGKSNEGNSSFLFVMLTTL